MTESEKWLVVEQLAIASIHAGNASVAKQCIDKLQLEFGTQSIRVRQLTGMMAEMKGDQNAALATYNSILSESDDCNQTAFASKRKIALQIASGSTSAAVDALVEYLTIMSTDTEAWECLCNCYRQTLNWEQALFCLEELIMLRPQSAQYYLAYADTLLASMSTWTADGVQMAAKYYALALECRFDDVDALMGWKKCFNHMLTLNVKKNVTGMSEELDVLVSERLALSLRNKNLKLDEAQVEQIQQWIK